MLRTFLRQKRILAAGVAATLVASALSYWLEWQSINRRQIEATEAQIERVRERLFGAQMEIDAALAMLMQPTASVASFNQFLSNLTISRDPSVQWLVGGVIASSQSARFEQPIAALLEQPAFKLRNSSAGYLMPVLSSRGNWGEGIAGQDLSATEQLYSIIEARLGGQAQEGSRFDLLTLQSKPFQENSIWYVATARDGLKFDGLPAAPIYLMRGVSLDTLVPLAALRESQQLRITIEKQGVPDDPPSVIPVASEPIAGATKQVHIGSSTLSISMTVPVWPRWPRSWILVLLLGFATTAFAAAARAGFFVAANARLLSRDLQSTQSELHATSFRENTFFEESSTASAEVEATTGKLLRVNEAFYELLGYGKQELLGRLATEFTPPDDHETNLMRLEPAKSAPGESVQFETRFLRKDGSVIWGLLRARLYQDAAGESVRYLVTVIDITDRKNDEITRNNLLRELAHRVRNTVQIVSSMARQTARSSRSVSDYDEKFRARLAALSAAQDALFESEWRGADLNNLVQRTLAPFFGAERSLDVAHVRIPAQHAQTIAIALHELASNALHRSGAPNLFNEIALSIELAADPEDGQRKMHLIWREPSGRQMRKSGRQGFGHMMLYQSLPEQFGGRANSRNEKGQFVYEAWLALPFDQAYRQ